MQLLITVQDIRDAHPAVLDCETNLDYAKVGNKLLQRMRRMILPKEITGEIKKILALKVTLYFEDIICDCGIWRSFVEKHHELYGRWLPFYDIIGEYYADEPHLEDIALLLWDSLYFEMEEGLLDPYTPYLFKMAEELYEVLEDEFEKTPINVELKAYFEEALFLDDFIDLKVVLQWVYHFCYLTTGRETIESTETECEIVQKVLHLENEGQVLYAALSQVCFKVKVGMLALLPQEWLALILEKNMHEKEAQEVRQMEYHSYDLFLKKNHDDVNIYLSDTLGQDITVRIDDYLDMSEDTLNKTEGCIASFVKYRGEWHVNGIDSWGKLGEVYEEEYNKKQRYKTGIPQKTYEHLMEKSGGSPLFYFRDARELCQFFVDEMKMPVQMVQSALLEDRKYIAFWIPSANSVFHISHDVALSIRDARNPYYHAKKDPEGPVEILVNGDLVPGDMLRYLIDHDMLPDLEPLLDSVPGNPRSKIDFFARTLRRNKY